MINVEILRRVYHGGKVYLPGMKVYANDSTARLWFALGAAKLDEPKAKVVEKAVKASPVPTGGVKN